MAITFDTSGKASGSTGTATLSYTVGAGSGALMIIAISGQSADALFSFSAPTYNGVSGTHLTQISDNNNTYTDAWYINSPTQGSAHNISITNSAGGNFEMYVTTYLGTSGIPNNSTTAQTSGSSVTLNITTAQDNSWTGSYLASQNSIPSAGTGTTARQTNTGPNGGIGDSNGAIHPAGSTSMQWTFTSGAYSAVMFEIPVQNAGSGANHRALLGVGI